MKQYIIELNGSIMKDFIYLSMARNYYNTLCNCYNKNIDIIRLYSTNPFELISEF